MVSGVRSWQSCLSFAVLKQTGSVHFCAAIGLDAGAQVEALLRDGDFAAGGLAEGEERDAGLADEAFHDLVDGLVAGCGLRVPEIFGRGVAVEMCGEIVVHALAECFGAEVVLDA